MGACAQAWTRRFIQQRAEPVRNCSLWISSPDELHRSRSFLDQERLICSQKILADLGPLQLVLNPAASISPHFFLKLGLLHELCDGFCEFSFFVWFNINSTVSRRKPCLFQIEGDDGLCIRHVFH